MNELLEDVIAAHGGLARWKAFAKVQATIVTGGALRGMKGLVPNEHMQTSIDSIFAVGDVNGIALLNSVATAQANVAVQGEHFKPGATRPSSQFASPGQFTFPDTNERRSPGVGH